MIPSRSPNDRLQAPTGIVPALLAVGAGFLLRCPVCRRGHLFPKLLTYRMRERCPNCEVEFEPDRGEVTGGMAINMVLTSLLVRPQPR